MMLGFLKEIFKNDEDINKAEKFSEEQKIQIATCTLFIEVAKADSNYSPAEYEKITTLLKQMYNLDDEQIHELMELAGERIMRSVSLYEFTQIINNHFSQDEKYELMKNIWEVVYADNTLDKYEEHLVRIISNNLNLSHRDMIAAKLSVKKK